MTSTPETPAPVNVRLHGRDTAGHLALIEFVVDSHSGSPPLHIHPAHAEGVYVLRASCRSVWEIAPSARQRVPSFSRRWARRTGLRTSAVAMRACSSSARPRDSKPTSTSLPLDDTRYHRQIRR